MRLFLIFLSIITIYPFIFVLFASVSDPVLLMAHRGILWKPLGFTIKGYILSFSSPDLMDGYKITAFLVIVGTGLQPSDDYAFRLCFGKTQSYVEQPFLR